MNMNKLITVAAVAASAAIPMSANAASITIDSVQQRWPWNNKVDITYTVSGGQDVAAGVYAKLVFTATIAGQTYTIDGVHDIGASASDGTHTVTWTPPADIRAKATDCTMTATLSAADNPSGDDYMIIDLDATENAISYEGLLWSQSASNDRYNTNAVYKTTKIVLRKVPRWADRGQLPNAASFSSLGGYPTGDNTNFSSLNSRKNWLTKSDYYIGVFPVTQAQYQKVVESNPSEFQTDATGNTAAHRPVEKVSWNTLRDNLATTSSITPSASGGFLARLNNKTQSATSAGVTGFDLPTEVMYEIAMRAGATTVYPWGNTDSDGLVYVISKDNPGDGTTWAVGSRLPNDWGLFDMIGNVRQWCLDCNGRNSTNLSEPAKNLNTNVDAFTPVYTSNSNRRVYRGGGSYNTSLLMSSSSAPQRCRASFRDSGTPATVYPTLGFRIGFICK